MKHCLALFAVFAVGILMGYYAERSVNVDVVDVQASAVACVCGDDCQCCGHCNCDCGCSRCKK